MGAPQVWKPVIKVGEKPCRYSKSGIPLFEEWEGWMRRPHRIEQEADAMWAEVFAEMGQPFVSLEEEKKRSGMYDYYKEMFSKDGGKI